MSRFLGTAFSINERERLSIRGLVPPRRQEMNKQLLRVKRNLDACETPLAKFVFLSALQDRNETLFYKLLIQHLEELSGIIYTPTGKFVKFFAREFPFFSDNSSGLLQWVWQVKSRTVSTAAPVACTSPVRIVVSCLPWSTTGLTMRSMLLSSPTAPVSLVLAIWEPTECRYVKKGPLAECNSP